MLPRLLVVMTQTGPRGGGVPGHTVSQQLGRDPSHPNPTPLEVPLMSPGEPITQVCLLGHAAGRFQDIRWLSSPLKMVITAPTFPRALDLWPNSCSPNRPRLPGGFHEAPFWVQLVGPSRAPRPWDGRASCRCN